MKEFLSKHIALKVDVIGAEDVLFAGASVHLSARKYFFACCEVFQRFQVIMQISEKTVAVLVMCTNQNIIHLLMLSFFQNWSTATQGT